MYFKKNTAFQHAWQLLKKILISIPRVAGAGASVGTPGVRLLTGITPDPMRFCRGPGRVGIPWRRSLETHCEILGGRFSLLS